jgi:ubiquinone/menaquinone biosynthesis C-methylase UbiE
MSEDTVIPFWGPQQMDLFARMAQAIDPGGRIPAAMAAVAPIDGRILLDVGAGVGDRTIQYAGQAAHVYALEPDPETLPILRGRIKSADAGNVTVVPAGAADISLQDGCVDVAYATWAYFFGPGSEPGLAEVRRVLRPAGDFVVVQNYGHDELSRFWASFEDDCQNWPPWFAEQGFTCQVIDTVWRFSSSAEALAVLEFLWGEPARDYVLEHDKAEFGYKVALYHQRVSTHGDTGGLID